MPWASCGDCSFTAVGKDQRGVSEALAAHKRQFHTSPKTIRCRLCGHLASALTKVDAKASLQRHMDRAHDPLEAREALGERHLEAWL